MASAVPMWVNVRHDEKCKCGRALIGGEDRGQYDMALQEFVACEACSPEVQSAAAGEIVDAIEPAAQPSVNVLGELVRAVESFARANGCPGKVDLMLAGLIRAAK